MTDERMKKLEKTVQHLSRRAPGRAIAVVPPTIVSFYADAPAEDGKLCAFVSPVTAVVKTVAFHTLESQLAKDTAVTIKHVGAITSEMTVPLKYASFVRDLKYELAPGDVVQVFINHPDMIRNVSVSILLEMEERSVEKIRLSMDELLAQESSDA